MNRHRGRFRRSAGAPRAGGKIIRTVLFQRMPAAARRAEVVGRRYYYASKFAVYRIRDAGRSAQPFVRRAGLAFFAEQKALNAAARAAQRGEQHSAFL